VLGDNVESQGRFVEKQDFRLVQQGGNQLHLCPFSQGKFPDRFAYQAGDLEQGGEFLDRPPSGGPVDAVDGTIELETFAGTPFPVPTAQSPAPVPSRHWGEAGRRAS